MCEAIILVAPRTEDKILKEAILNYTVKPVTRLKKVYMHGKYPAVSIYKEKIHIHRLIAILLYGGKVYEKKYYVHHINGNRKDARKNNLILMDISEHQRLHNKGKTISNKHKNAIRNYNLSRPKVKRGHDGRYVKTYIHEDSL